MWERHPGPLARTAAAYPFLQFGTIGDPWQEEYTAHAFRIFADVETRLALVSLGYTQDTCVLPDAGKITGLSPALLDLRRG